MSDEGCTDDFSCIYVKRWRECKKGLEAANARVDELSAMLDAARELAARAGAVVDELRRKNQAAEVDRSRAQAERNDVVRLLDDTKLQLANQSAGRREAQEALGRAQFELRKAVTWPELADVVAGVGNGCYHGLIVALRERVSR